MVLDITFQFQDLNDFDIEFSSYGNYIADMIDNNNITIAKNPTLPQTKHQELTNLEKSTEKLHTVQQNQ